MIQKHLLHYSHNLLWRCKIQSTEETGEFKWRTLSDAKRRWNWKRKPLQLFLLLNHLLKLGARSHLRCTIVMRKLGKNSCTIKPNFIALISPETLVYNPQIVFTMWIFIIIQVVVKKTQKREKKPAVWMMLAESNMQYWQKYQVRRLKNVNLVTQPS